MPSTLDPPVQGAFFSPIHPPNPKEIHVFKQTLQLPQVHSRCQIRLESHRESRNRSRALGHNRPHRHCQDACRSTIHESDGRHSHGLGQPCPVRSRRYRLCFLVRSAVYLRSAAAAVPVTGDFSRISVALRHPCQHP